MTDYAIVGSGIGGSAIAALLNARGYEVLLFEKEPYLGGCSSTFEHGGYRYNTGATTFAGYQKGHVVRRIFEQVGYTPKLISTDPSIVVIHNDKTTPRYRDLDRFLSALQANYPHSRHTAFWQLVDTLNQDFYAMQNYYYSGRSLWAKIRSLASFVPLFSQFGRYLTGDAERFIERYYGGMEPEYQQFLESQVLIVAQAPLKEINFLTAALALGYTFHETYYASGGMSRLMEGLTEKIPSIQRNTTIRKIERMKGYYRLHTQKGHYCARRLILNTTMYDSAKLFEDQEIKAYYARHQKLNNYQSSFMVYLTIRSDVSFCHHYQLIASQPYPDTLSRALFVSFSDLSDRQMAPEGHYSITASIHTDLRWWQDKATYRQKKEALMAQLIETICTKLSINQEQIIHHFAATPRTFGRYIHRTQLGGNPVTLRNFLPRLPANDTPVPDLYHVGDSVYAAQGWPGVMMGVQNLAHLLRI
jgi:phytoene dehydrogenase-like protein